MKCLLCKEQFNRKEQLKQHYISFHIVDPTNHFFQKRFKSRKNRTVSNKCLLCNNNFSKHHKDGKLDPFENKPVEINYLGNIASYEITVRNIINTIILKIQKKS